MSLADVLNAKKAKLAKVTTVDSSNIEDKLGGNQEQFKQYQQRVLDYNIEEWYEAIKEFTFETSFVAITVEHAAALKAAYQELVLSNESQLSLATQQLIDSLQQELQLAIDKMVEGDGPSGSGAVFVKTSSRSAKDAPATKARLVELYHKYYNQFEEKTDNSKMISLLKAQIDSFMIKTGKEVLDSFTRSERIYQDMMLALDNAQRFKQNFVIRKWYTIEPDMEFRGFVCNSKLTAVSQYHHLVYFPRLLQSKKEIIERILEFWPKVHVNLENHPLLNGKYIIDFAFCGEDQSVIKIIEINPFLETTDSCLFSWVKERELLENGDSSGNTQFRFREKEMKGSLSMISDWWKDITKT